MLSHFTSTWSGVVLCCMRWSPPLATALTDGEIDAGPVPVVDCFRLADSLQPVAGFCVATPQKTGSIFLYSTTP